MFIPRFTGMDFCVKRLALAGASGFMRSGEPLHAEIHARQYRYKHRFSCSLTIYIVVV